MGENGSGRSILRGSRLALPRSELREGVHGVWATQHLDPLCRTDPVSARCNPTQIVADQRQLGLESVLRRRVILSPGPEGPGPDTGELTGSVVLVPGLAD